AYLAGLTVWAAAVALDIVGTWPLDGAIVPLTAATAVGPALLLCVPVRPARDIMLAASALGAVLLVVVIWRALPNLQLLGPGLVTVAIAVAPPVVGVQIVRSLRTL